MKHSQYGKEPKNYAIAAMILFNKVDIPFQRDSPGGRISDPQEKLEFIQESLNGFFSFDPGIYLETFVIINAGTDCELTKAYYKSLDATTTKYGTKIVVLDAPDERYPGPFGSVQAVYHAFPSFRYYLTVDNDCIPIKDNWFKDGIDRMRKDDEIGLLGGWMTKEPFQCPSHIEYIDIDGKVLDPSPKVYYTSGFFSYIRGHIYQLFDEYWGKEWFPYRDGVYRDFAVHQGELMFAHKIQQLGYKVADFNDPETDAPLAWHVPDILFPNKTTGNVFPDPHKPKISPFFHTYLKMRMPHKWDLLVKYAKDHSDV